jgi:uncharacterized membrane protein
MCVCIHCLRTAVRLEWKPSDESDVLYAASINVYCTDRKYLLSDVSIVVSRETMIQVTRHILLNTLFEHTKLCESLLLLLGVSVLSASCSVSVATFLLLHTVWEHYVCVSSSLFVC